MKGKQHNSKAPKEAVVKGGTSKSYGAKASPHQVKASPKKG